jgi:hypothetical protein
MESNEMPASGRNMPHRTCSSASGQERSSLKAPSAHSMFAEAIEVD